MYFGALLLKLVYPGLQVGQLALELLNLLGVWLHGLVEGSSEKVGHTEPHWGGIAGRWHCLGPHRHGVVGSRSTLSVRGLLGLLLAGVHILIVERQRLTVMGLFATRFWALICFVVE